MVLSDCKGGEEGNYTFDGCVHIMLDMQKLCLALNIHAYLFGSLFLLMILVACLAFYPLVVKKRSTKSVFMITINVLVIIFGVMRCLNLYIDAYGLRGFFGPLGSLLFADLAIPCLTSAFALVQWAFLELLQIRRITKALQSPRVLIAIIAFHFIFVLIIDFLLFFIGNSVCYLMVVCQSVTALWGVALTIGFLYTTHKLFKRDKEHRATLKKAQGYFKTTKKNRGSTVKNSNSSFKTGTNASIRSDQNLYIQSVSRTQNMTNAEQHNNLNSEHHASETDTSNAYMESEIDMTENDPIILRPLKRLRNTLKSSLSKSQHKRRSSYLTKVKNVGIFTTIIGIALFGVSLYGIAIYNPFDVGPMPGDWAWYTFQTLFRILELGFGFTMVYLSMSRNTG